MALKRFAGPAPDAHLVVLGQDFGIVQKGKQVVVPDELADAVVWPDCWEDVTAPPPNPPAPPSHPAESAPVVKDAK